MNAKTGFGYFLAKEYSLSYLMSTFHRINLFIYKANESQWTLTFSDIQGLKINFIFLDFFSKNNPGVMFYNIFIIVFDLAFLLVKFWFYTFHAIYLNLKGIEERDVSNEIVLITGTGHGIGKELALQYSALGSTVVCWDINEQMNQDTIKLIKSKGGKASGYT